MKSISIIKIFFLLNVSFSIFLVFSCKTNAAFDKDGLPKVTEAFYKMYDISGERGYKVRFKILNKEFLPYAVIINGIKKNISEKDRKNNTEFEINVITQTQIFENYKIEVTNQTNGVLFKNKESYTLVPVKFNLEK